MTKVSARSRMLGGVFGCGFLLLAGAAIADPPTDPTLKDKPQQTKPAVNGAQAVKPGQGVTMTGVGTSSGTAGPGNPGAGAAWGGQSGSVTTPTGTQSFGSGTTVSTPGGGKETFGGSGWGATGSSAAGSLGANSFGSNGVAHGSQGGVGAGPNGTGSAGPHMNNGGLAGAMDGDDSTGSSKSKGKADGGSPSFTDDPIGWAQSKFGGDSNGSDSSSKSNTPKGAGWTKNPDGGYSPPQFKPKGKGGDNGGDMEADMGGSSGGGGRSAANGSTINLGNRGGGDSGGKGGGSGQTDQGGTSGGAQANATGQTMNLGAKAGGDAPLKKPSTAGEALDKNKLNNGAIDPKLGTGGPGGR